MRNILLLIISLVLVVLSVMVPHEVKTKEDLSFLTCGFPMPYLTQDFSSSFGERIPDSKGCTPVPIGVHVKNFDIVAFLISMGIVFGIFQLGVLVKNHFWGDSTQSITKYPASPIRVNLDDNPANSF